MAVKKKIIIVLLLWLMESQSYASNNTDFHKFDQPNSEPNSHHRNTMHNVTIDCGDLGAQHRTLIVCQSQLWHYAVNGNVWFGGHPKKVGRNQRPRNGSDSLRDSLDSLNYACTLHERSGKCLDEYGVRDYCISRTRALAEIMDFQFICQHQKRDENLVHAIRCLRDERILAMLLFHIGNRCVGGMDILDDLMARTKSAYFYTLDINPATETTLMPMLYCLPRHVISTCVGEIVEDHCGKRSSRLVQDYLLYCQDWFDHSLKSAGLASNICEYNISSNFPQKMPPIVSSERHENVGFVTGIEMRAPGTALDTVSGRWLVAYLQSVSWQGICSDIRYVYGAYTACVKSSDAKYERSKFNILQFGHGLFGPSFYHGTQCSRLEQFNACWKQLQQMCGPVTRGFKQHATLLVEGCKIQSEMEAAGCHWQDMMLRRYIHASRVTVWPIPGEGLQNPLFLDSPHDKTRSMNDLDTVIALLQPGVDEISRKCGQQPAKRLRVVLQQLRYLQYDAVKMVDVIVNLAHHMIM